MDSRLKLILNGDPEEVLMLLVRLKNPEVHVPFCNVITQFGDVITCRVQRKHLLIVYNSPHTFSVKAPRLILASFQKEEAESKSYGTNINPSRRFELPYTGKGVYFAAIDWGFDFAHSNLCNPDGSTRFTCIWDQNGPYDGNKYGYGCVYEQEKINQALQTNTPYQTLGYHPGSSDTFGTGMHGTHVVDIATGTPNVGEGGVATEARLIGVQLGNNFVNGSDLALGDSVRLNEAIDFIHAHTRDAPCVINMSLGSHGDSHTGRSLVEISLDNFLIQNPGYAIVQSVGNYYSANCHLQYTIKQGETYNIEWNIPRRNPFPNEVEIWYPGSDQFSVRLIAPDGATVADTEPFEDFQISYQNNPVGYIFHRLKEPNTGLNHIDIVLDISILKGKWMIQVTGLVVKNGSFNAYCERNDVSQAKFSPHQSSGYTTTGSICNGKHAITVGAYDHNDPTKPVVRFSSSGPTASGQPKPDLLAPGYKISAARSAPASALLPTNGLTVKSGSSMAAPHVSGSIALLFQKHLPDRLTISKIKELLFKALDPLPVHFSASDNTRAGKGFLNIKNFLRPENFSMSTTYITRPARRPQAEVESGDYTDEQKGYHAPYLHPNCRQCEDALLESIDEGVWENETELLNLVNESYSRDEAANSLEVYRHFHPQYQFSYSPYEINLTPVALPGRRFTGDLLIGDVVLIRTVLTGKNQQGIIINPELLSHEVMNGSATNSQKPGYYVQVYGNIDGKSNEKQYLKIADSKNITPGNVIVLRANKSPLDNPFANNLPEDNPNYNESIVNPGQIPVPGVSVIPKNTSNLPGLPGTIDVPNVPIISTPVSGATSGNGTQLIDPTDERIDVRAKFSLQRMLKQGGQAAVDATNMINAINTGQLAGIDGDNTFRAVQIARQKNTQRWLLVSKGKDAELVQVPSGPPSIVFRDGIEKNPSRLDAALRSAWSSFAQGQVEVPIGAPYIPFPQVGPPGILPVDFPNPRIDGPYTLPPRVGPLGIVPVDNENIPVIIVPGILGTRLIDPDSKEMIWNPFFPKPIPFEDGFGEIAMNFERLSKMNKHLIPADNANIPVANENFLNAFHIPNFGNLNYSSYHKLAFELNSGAFKTQLIAKNLKPLKVYACGYDWRQSNLSSATTLNNVVDDAIKNSTSEKVILIAHSMGGLVSRLFCSPNGLKQASKVACLILLGSPTQGAPAVYKLLKEGKLFSDIKLFPTGFSEVPDFLSGLAKKGLGRLLLPKNFTDIVRLFPSVYELLPTDFFCKKNKNWVKFNIDDTKSLLYPNGIADASDPQKLYGNEFTGIMASSFSNQWIIDTHLQNRSKIDKRINGYTPEQTHTLFTQNISTEVGYTVQKQFLTGNPFLQPEELKDGDARVPLFSARASGLSNVVETFSISSNPEHSDIPNNPEVIKKIKEIIEAKIPTIKAK